MSAPEYSGRTALNRALDRALATDFRVILLGQDLSDPIGGRHGVTRGLSTAHGSHRVLDLPASVTAMCGAAVGAALEGMAPVVELPAAPVSGAILDQLAHVAVFQEQQRAATYGSLVFRVPVPDPEARSDSHLDRFTRIPGLKVVQPDTPAAAETLLLAAIRDPAPSVVFEPVRLYRILGPQADAAEGESPLDADEFTFRGADATVVTCHASRAAAMHAAADLATAGIEIDIIGLRARGPLDTEAVFRSVARTRRLVLAPGTTAHQGTYLEIAELVNRDLGDRLAAPVEHAREPTGTSGPEPADIIAAVRTACGYSRSRVPGR
ncbi:transketolase C-terminal domain-containing protein [Amycolatopsis sp. RTGN1]|uniref:transketolase C-terminal domain-containing protein n=1 Tax=Amycolatopsis ponsaeliensis TaxID=2992142 RepID=UPI00254E27DC|nr:transketolase C-terminal domain-containing protein [Amycolatopsis sp. RTGN1]